MVPALKTKLLTLRRLDTRKLPPERVKVPTVPLVLTITDPEFKVNALVSNEEAMKVAGDPEMVPVPLTEVKLNAP